MLPPQKKKRRFGELAMVYSRYIKSKHVVNTRYFKNILKIYTYIIYYICIYIFIARLEYHRYTTGMLNGILEVY